MGTLLPATLAFSAIAALAVALAGRRAADGSDRLSGLALLMLLALPVLACLPGWAVLPAARTAAGQPSWFLGGILVAGTGLLLIRLGFASVKVSRWIRASRPVGHCHTRDGRRIEIRTLPGLSSPCAAGIRRPVILVPEDWHDQSPVHREMVLVHEAAHHQRRDPLWRLLGALACALHWFNPLVWWLARRHAWQAELACDAAVLASGAPASRYAHLLCDLARPRATPLVAAMAGSTLGKRVVQLQRPVRRLSRPTLILAGLLLVAAGVACGLSRPLSPVPASEVRLRLAADPFPGN